VPSLAASLLQIISWRTPKGLFVVAHDFLFSEKEIDSPMRCPIVSDWEKILL
jgi:hypothetical protein